MSRSTFRVLFYLKRNAPKKNGLIPVMCRVTVNGKVSQFSCKLDVEEKMWSVELGRMSGRSIVAQETNRKLEKIRVGINKAYQEICDKDNYVTAEKVRNAYLGMGMNHKTLLAVFRLHNEDYAKLVGKMKSKRSYLKYQVVYKHLSEFVKQRYKQEDIALKELTPAFITDFEVFLRIEKGHCTNTVWSYMMPFRSIIFMAINNGWLSRDPFYAYHITREETKRGFLTMEEITKLINGKFTKKKYELVRDLFVFCCFTGLSWTDMRNLTKDNRLLPVPVYSSCKYDIKQVAKQCGIEKNVTWHMSRHTMATEICLTNGVPIETVSSILGHKDIKTTQIYAKITKEKLNKDMDKLSLQLNHIDEYMGKVNVGTEKGENQ